MKPLMISLLALLIPLLIAAGAQGCTPKTDNPYDYEGTHVILHTDENETLDCISVGIGSGTHLVNCRPVRVGQ